MESRKIRSLIESELLEPTIKECCKIAFLSGAIRGAGELNFTMKGFSLEFRHLNKVFIDTVAKIINGLYDENLSIELINLKSGYLSGEFFTLYVPVNIAKDLLEKCNIIVDDSNIINSIPNIMVKNICCKKAYLKGLYLACGYLKLPESIDNFELNNTRCGYELSFKLNSYLVKDDIKSLITKVAKVNAKSVCLRKNTNIIYIKNSEAICNFFTAIGSNKGVLEIYQIITERRMKNDINRANNFDLANIDKSVETGGKQIDAINKLDEEIGLENLPDAIRKLAYLRLANPDASLVYLAEISDPPVTKSCINHRLRKLMELANKDK